MSFPPSTCVPGVQDLSRCCVRCCSPLGQSPPTQNCPVAALVGTPGVIWKGSSTTKATMTDRGVVTGRLVGNTTITATSAGVISDYAVLRGEVDAPADALSSTIR